jgi:hypothetical protein
LLAAFASTRHCNRMCGTCSPCRFFGPSANFVGERIREGVPVPREPAWLTSTGMDAAAQAASRERRPGMQSCSARHVSEKPPAEAGGLRVPRRPAPHGEWSRPTSRCPRASARGFVPGRRGSHRTIRAEQDCPEGRSHRPATGHGRPRPTENPDGPLF